MVGTDIALRKDLSEEEVELIKKTICKGASDQELELFIGLCNRTGLDPFAKQVYAIRYGPDLVFQTSIDGFRLIAERTGLYRGQDGPYWCGLDGKWSDVWTLQDPPLAARVGVLKQGRSKPLYAVAHWDEYENSRRSQFWRNKPRLMLAKCAEALALRRAFPQELSGLYTRDEMQEEIIDRDVKPADPERGKTITVGEYDPSKPIVEKIDSEDPLSSFKPGERFKDDNGNEFRKATVEVSEEGMRELCAKTGCRNEAYSQGFCLACFNHKSTMTQAQEFDKQVAKQFKVRTLEEVKARYPELGPGYVLRERDPFTKGFKRTEDYAGMTMGECAAWQAKAYDVVSGNRELWEKLDDFARACALWAVELRGRRRIQMVKEIPHHVLKEWVQSIEKEPLAERLPDDLSEDTIDKLKNRWKAFEPVWEVFKTIPQAKVEEFEKDLDQKKSKKGPANRVRDHVKRWEKILDEQDDDHARRKGASAGDKKKVDTKPQKGTRKEAQARVAQEMEQLMGLIQKDLRAMPGNYLDNLRKLQKQSGVPQLQAVSLHNLGELQQLHSILSKQTAA